MQTATQFTVIAHLDVDTLVQAELDEIQWLLDRLR
jgi:hypothetical protein